MFLKRTNLSSDLKIIRDNLDDILKQTDWGIKNQIGLNYRPGSSDSWHDAAGSLFDHDAKKFINDEWCYTQWNILPEYLHNEILRLRSVMNTKIGRVRFMRLMPKTGLSVHNDREFRYHFVVKTNPHAYIAHQQNYKVASSVLPTEHFCYHIPADGWWYKVNTTQIHWVYNGGTEERIHLVACGE